MKTPSAETRISFFIGSGRCGTRTFFKMLAGHPQVEIHHEYLCAYIQPLAVMYFMKKLSRHDTLMRLKSIYNSALFYSKKEFFIDSSNKATWLIDPLLELFPGVKFIGLVRDGRKVVASYYYKLKDEIYHDDCVNALYKWYEQKFPMPPPPEKKYWWNLPPFDSRDYKIFKTYSRFERICWHWQAANEALLHAKERFGENIIKIIKFEDLLINEELLRSIFDFLGIKYKSIYFQFLKRPRNVFFPFDFKLPSSKEEIFWEICGETMKKMGYCRELPQYETRY